MISKPPQYNLKNTGVKRLMKEAAELRNPTDMYYAQPLEDNLFEWHFTVRGPADTDFDGGIYHGRILLPADYPMKPPSVILLTPNGRFQLNQKICLSISGHHPESWQPSWSIRTALLALIGFMPTHGAGALGALEYPPEERRKLAKQSRDWVCKECGLCMRNALASGGASGDSTDAMEARHLATQISFKEEKEAKKPETVGLPNAHAMGDAVTTTAAAAAAAEAEMQADASAEVSGDMSANLRHRRTSQPQTVPPVTTVSRNADILQSSPSRRYSWELLCIWLLSIVVIGLIMRRLFLLQSNEMA